MRLHISHATIKPHKANVHQSYVDEFLEMFRLVSEQIDFEAEKIIPFFK